MSGFLLDGDMEKIRNSLLMTHVLKALFAVVGRRTLDSFAIQILKTALVKLEVKYNLFTLLTVSDEFFTNDEVHISVDPAFETIDSLQLGNGIDALIRVIYMELIDAVGDEVGRFFITELKEKLGDTITNELIRCNVHLDILQSEQHLRYQMKDIPTSSSFLQKEEPQQHSYDWDTVSTWKYDNNVCRLYDSKGKLLDTLYLDLLIEEYVERVAEAKKNEFVPAAKTIMRKVTEKETELLQMMQRRDIDVESAVSLLHISRQKLDVMIQKLLQLEMLQFISESELKITEKGVAFLTESK